MLSIYDIYDILPFLGCVLKWLPASTYYWLVGKNTGPTRAIKLGWNIHLWLGGLIQIYRAPAPLRWHSSGKNDFTPD